MQKTLEVFENKWAFIMLTSNETEKMNFFTDGKKVTETTYTITYYVKLRKEGLNETFTHKDIAYDLYNKLVSKF